MRLIFVLFWIFHGCADSNQSGYTCEIVNIYCKSSVCPQAYKDVRSNQFVSKNNCSETIDSVLD